MEKTIEILKQLPDALLPWYEIHCRDLPWRKDQEPYHVWLSEVMLQQTRVEAVKSYYLRFLKELPTVKALSECEDDRLSKLWEGLGYYSRMRNLKKAAGIIQTLYCGKFPAEYDEIRSLPGIGDYTAGAICSIAYNMPTPAVDGNVLRVVSRLLEDDTPIDLVPFKRKVRDDLAKIYPEKAGIFTQALMELGATVCGPNRAPVCDNCPCREFCLAAKHGTAGKFPVKLPKRARRVENRTVFILRSGEDWALTRRPNHGLLAGLWQFPDVQGMLEVSQAAQWVQDQGLHVQQILCQMERKHVFTHIEWNMRGFFLEVQEKGGPFTWMTGPQIDAEAALPTAYRQFWEDKDFV